MDFEQYRGKIIERIEGYYTELEIPFTAGSVLKIEPDRAWDDEDSYPVLCLNGERPYAW